MIVVIFFSFSCLPLRNLTKICVFLTIVSFQKSCFDSTSFYPVVIYPEVKHLILMHLMQMKTFTNKTVTLADFGMKDTGIFSFCFKKYNETVKYDII